MSSTPAGRFARAILTRDSDELKRLFQADPRITLFSLDHAMCVALFGGGRRGRKLLSAPIRAATVTERSPGFYASFTWIVAIESGGSSAFTVPP
jgi:hypothetical protein